MDLIGGYASGSDDSGGEASPQLPRAAQAAQNSGALLKAVATLGYVWQHTAGLVQDRPQHLEHIDHPSAFLIASPCLKSACMVHEQRQSTGCIPAAHGYEQGI